MVSREKTTTLKQLAKSGSLWQTVKTARPCGNYFFVLVTNINHLHMFLRLASLKRKRELNLVFCVHTHQERALRKPLANTKLNSLSGLLVFERTNLHKILSECPTWRVSQDHTSASLVLSVHFFFFFRNIILETFPAHLNPK